jgi:hypothetical protein
MAEITEKENLGVVFDRNSFSCFSAHVKYGERTSPPFFSKTVGKMFCLLLAKELELEDNELTAAVSVIESSEMPAEKIDLDEFVIDLHKKIAKDGLRLSYPDFVETARQLLLESARELEAEEEKAVREDGRSGESLDIVVVVAKGGRPQLSGEVALAAVGDSSGRGYFFLSGNVFTQPFFSNYWAWACLFHLSEGFGLEEKTISKLINMVARLKLPEKPTALDRAVARFNRTYRGTERPSRIYEHMLIMIQSGMFLDLFGDEADLK